MKSCKRALATVGLLVILSLSAKAQKTKVLVITGGHDFERRPFYAVFDAMPDISYDTLVQPAANALIAKDGVKEYDVLVFYDMFGDITPGEQDAYLTLVKQGKAIIFLHHALASYQDWTGFKNIVGGQYHEKPTVVAGDTLKSNYKHDVAMNVLVIDSKHPVTAGIKDFDILDERYGDCEVLPGVKALLDTHTKGSMRPLAWINHYGNSDIVYIQLGHGPTAYGHLAFRRLLRQAIAWSAGHHRKFRR